MLQSGVIMNMPDLYVFSSDKTSHVALAVRDCIWKVGITAIRKPQLRGKADSIIPGEFGVFYDSETRRLTVPFVFVSEVASASTDSPFQDGGPYCFEFRLFPLGPMSLYIAYGDLPANLQNRVKPISVFVPCAIEKEDWLRLLEKLTPIKIEELRRLGYSRPNSLLSFLEATR
jgi:hypothetical protein